MPGGEGGVASRGVPLSQSISSLQEAMLLREIRPPAVTPRARHHQMKPSSGPPMTLGAAAAAQILIIV